MLRASCMAAVVMMLSGMHDIVDRGRVTHLGFGYVARWRAGYCRLRERSPAEADCKNRGYGCCFEHGLSFLLGKPRAQRSLSAGPKRSVGLGGDSNRAPSLKRTNAACGLSAG